LKKLRRCLIKGKVEVGVRFVFFKMDLALVDVAVKRMPNAFRTVQ